MQSSVESAPYQLQPHPTMCYGIVIWALLICSLFSTVFAQSEPSLSVENSSLHRGEPLVISGRNLTPGSEYLLTLTAPGNIVINGTLTADTEGTIGYSFPLGLEGEWVVNLRGSDIDANLNVQVLPTSASEDIVTDEPEAPPGEPEPPSVVPEDHEPAIRAFELDGNAVVAKDNEREVWRLSFAANSGATNALLEHDGSLYLAHGNSVLELQPATGEITERTILSGPVTDVRESEGREVLLATVTHTSGVTEQFTFGPQGVQEVVRFGADPTVLSWLRAEASVAEPAVRLEQDPTNPWLYLEAGLLTDDPETAQRAFESALEHAETFYDLAHMSRRLFASGQDALAQEAMSLALRDFAARGYTPELLTDLELHEAYGFPLRPFQRSLVRGDLEEAAAWAEWLYLLGAPGIPEIRNALLVYADLLREAGERDAASLWRERARELRRFNLASNLDQLFAGIAQISWVVATVILIAFFILHLTLWAKYWSPQTLHLKRRRELGGVTRSDVLLRFLAVRYYTLTEKLVLVLLLATCILSVGLARWSAGGSDLPPALQTGTLASAEAGATLNTFALQGERAAFLLGYAAQTAGDLERARAHYEEALDFAPAINNLAVQMENDSLYQRALDISPGLRAAGYNLGRTANPSPFHAHYRPDDPLLVVPGPTDFQTALAGSWEQAIADTFINPWSGLLDAQPAGLPRLLWGLIVVLFLLLAITTLLSLLLPRPRLARNAPRTFLYHLLALLVPGSGLADELWGILLIIPWSVFGADALAQLLGWNLGVGLELQTDYLALIVLYGINTVAFGVEFVSYRRRMNLLRQADPETAQAFGLRLPQEPSE
ncbi:MAG: hypothetical protein JSV66_12365 [Trueperaceae bacterium]|nr:MAG: hypothetical protein JSV66_12365 [Trueperaceae bacterium]